MKTSKFSFFGKVQSLKSALCASLPLAVMAVTGLAQDANAQCAGTAYVKVPDSWTSVYAYYGNSDNMIPSTAYDAATGYYVINLSTLSGNTASTFILHTTNASYSNIDYPGVWGISGSVYDNVVKGRPSSGDLACPGSGNITYIAEDPLNLGHTYQGNVPPSARYLYVLAPQNADWVWSNLMVSTDGGVTGTQMKPMAGGRCGWFEMIWAAPDLPDEVVIYNSSNPALQLDVLPLTALLSAENPKLYYVPDDGNLDFVDPGKAGSCASAQGTKLFFLMPEDKDWQSATPLFSIDGGATGLAMKPAPGMCGWYYYEWGRGNPPPAEGIIMRSTNHEDQVGYNGFWGDMAPIPVKQLFVDRGSANLYFIPDDADWVDDESMGWYGTDPGVKGTCEFKLAAVIYDSDESLNPLFTSDGNNTGFGACTGVRHGIVKTELGPNKKPVFNSSANASVCMGDEANFNTLFNFTPGKNEVQCYDMTFKHYGSDPRWGFDSDSAVTGGYTGGFYPLEASDDASAIAAGTPAGQTCTGCRYKRYSQGPVPTTYTGDFDKYCNTPGWFGGQECEGKFNNGDNPGIWDWGAFRWESTHNQQFCFESHATFTYQEDQEFTFRGDDDIWVFIGGKLAVDNGGAHLAAPGHVVLKNLNTTYPDLNLTPGQDYALDIFFCDRRTTMSNVIIKTNMFIKQTSGLEASASKNKDGSTTYNVCYNKSGAGDCASMAGVGAGGSSSDEIHACGAEIAKYGNLKFSIYTRTGTKVADLTAGLDGMQYGGVNLKDQFNPKITVDKMSGLTPGSYRLVIDFCNAQGQCDEKARTYVNFRIKGNLDIVTRDVTYTVAQGDEKSPHFENGTKWKYEGKALAGARVPVYVSAVVDESIDPLSAVGQKYTLTLDEGMKAYTSKTGDTEVKFPKQVNETGVDTIWIYQGLEGMTAAVETKSVKLKATATIEFHVPELHFAQIASTDKDGNVTAWKHPVNADPDSVDGEENYHWIGSDVDLYMLVINPITNEICSECQFTLDLSDASKRVSLSDPINVTDGVGIVTINSKKEYMDSTAYIVISAAENPGLVFVKYTNLRFREPPVPYPVVVDIFDTKGAKLGGLAIPEPYYSESKNYLDGKADSLTIYYNRAFMPGPDGSYKDSLPEFICVNWDEDNLVSNDFYGKGLSTKKRDSTVQCSYIIEKEAILAAFKARPKGVDSVLSIALKDTAFSAEVKTAGAGKILNYAKFEDRGKISQESFDKGLTDRIAPVIVSARVDNFSDKLNRLTITLSEAVKLTDTTQTRAPFSYYMNSATEVSEDKRYANPKANAAPSGLNTNRVSLLYDKTQAATNPTPRLGDYVRFRADTWMWSDTTDIEGDVKRAEGDAKMHWNSPTKYNSKDRLPSSWVSIVGDYSVEVYSVNFATMDGEIDAKKTPVGEAFIIPTTAGKDEVKKLYPNTLGFIVKSDMNAFMSKDSATEAYFEKYPEKLNDVFFDYQVDYFTNLGGYVAGQSGRIYCKDEINKKKYGKEYFGGKDCTKNQGNFYIAWNMLSDKKRLVGTGAYIAKLTSYVKLADRGKAKGSKTEETEVWGAKRGKGLVK